MTVITHPRRKSNLAMMIDSAGGVSVGVALAQARANIEAMRGQAMAVIEAGISAPVRTPRGRDIDAACGQLKTAAAKMSRAELDRLAEEKQAALG